MLGHAVGMSNSNHCLIVVRLFHHQLSNTHFICHNHFTTPLLPFEGGAAGAVSRITGTLGKGIAALTLDEDYKRKRREQLARRPETFGAGLAQGGRGLFMGVFHGVTGVVTKPFEGAKKEGVEGFFKGMDFFGRYFSNLGLLNVILLADTTQEVSRVRPPRFIRSDGIIRPYDKHEADGHLILKAGNTVRHVIGLAHEQGHISWYSDWR
ncbi:unnamed protein product [Schistosoma mattheei]|uniref:Intermembrane lipid transfer protein VPS13-like C-terminal domain-containing protein n=1 Tax=Schistosoma mattheei TaxID=31246 RepID=A0A3P8GFP2_9TREM|nr:unnamed protein product [Schistosoma mattheei]